tara:strand:+ start:1176 stop:1775 length:600 start_codon:yes stop_codon:yes gene_type:complete
MKLKNLLSILVFSFSLALLGQEIERPDIIQLDSTWGKELFTFPLGFAQDIKYQGFEEARFPKGWNKMESPYFWTYTFAWMLDKDSLLTVHELEVAMQYYFDGVMSLEFERKTFPDIQDTAAVFLEKESTAKSSKLIGKIKTWDHFTSKKPITLNVQVDQSFCSEQENIIVLFRFSPKPFSDELWQSFGAITLKEDACQH